jgi:ketosteroid isomerase-like protein
MLSVVLALALQAAPQAPQTPPADPAPIVAAERAFAADFPALGLAGSFSKWGRPEGVIIAGGEARTVRELFADAPQTRQPGEPLIAWWPVFAGVARSGELGFTTGPAARDGEGYGHYFTIWRRQDDGSWRWVYDGGSSASPDGQPGPDSEPRLLPPATAWAAGPEAAWREVAEAEAALAAAARTDQAAAHLARLAPDGVLYVAPLPPATGGAAFAAALAGWPAQFEFGAAGGGGAADGGDLVWTYGPAGWVRDGQARRGHYVRLWQKRSEGWRLVMAQLIPAPVPAAAPPPAGGG